jgi:hypothetical protein
MGDSNLRQLIRRRSVSTGIDRQSKDVDGALAQNVDPADFTRGDVTVTISAMIAVAELACPNFRELSYKVRIL